MTLAEHYLKLNDRNKIAFLEGKLEACSDLERRKWIEAELTKLYATNQPPALHPQT